MRLNNHELLKKLILETDKATVGGRLRSLLILYRSHGDEKDVQPHEKILFLAFRVILFFENCDLPVITVRTKTLNLNI